MGLKTLIHRNFFFFFFLLLLLLLSPKEYYTFGSPIANGVLETNVCPPYISILFTSQTFHTVVTAVNIEGKIASKPSRVSASALLPKKHVLNIIFILRKLTSSSKILVK